MRLRLHSLTIALTLLATGACQSRTPSSPSPLALDGVAARADLVAAVDSARPPFGTAAAVAVDFAGCLEGITDPRCFSAALSWPADRVGAAGVNDPAAPLNLAVTVVGGTVTLTWVASSDPIIGFIIEAGSVPGAANLANFATGNPATAFTAGGIGAGTYYVRIRAMTTAAVSPASNEVGIVAGSGCAGAPGAPVLSVTTNTGGTVTFAWTVPAGNPTGYVLDVGSAPGLSNLASTAVSATTFTATGVPFGTYYVSVRARNACGTGNASASVTVTVSAGTAAAAWSDGFETYANAVFPSLNWTYSGNADIQVDNSQRAVGNQSVRLRGIIGGCWTALLHRRLTVTAPLTVEFYVRNGSEAMFGCHPVRGEMALHTGPSWTSGLRPLIMWDARGLVRGGGGLVGSLTGSTGIVLGSYVPNQWYKVKVGYERVGATSIRLSYWIDDQFITSEVSAALSFEGQMAYLSPAANEGTAWFDDIVVRPGQ